MTGLEILRVERLPVEPWKNKGGITRTIAAAPPDAGIDTADWRVALSDIERPGPFSHLPGIDRLLLPLGAGLRLGFDGAAPQPVSVFDTIAFDGATATICAVDARLQVVNLLLRRGRHAGRLQAFPGAGRLQAPGGAIVLHAARGGFNLVVADGVPRPLDAGHAAIHRDGALPLAFEPYRPWSMLAAAVIVPAGQS
ncbi:HutD family protein [Vineibacter terrae]|uniref:HutD/Ves family protein n=1 Tax=Vineibacter terrae TaxID=2586908 RepID=UPI002E36CA35|nr:HutD family protein [Vineibacter terrae]HEX2888016.1 HutD family protein [Vineibacter terrae]